MEIIKHRANKISDIENNYGLEVDVRDYNGKIVLSHDMVTEDKILFEEYLENVPKKSLLAINVKSSEIEKNLAEILQNSNHTNYFIFDCAIPQLIKSLQMGLKCAFRLSEYEKDEFPKCEWLWLDCFEKIWYDKDFLKKFKDKGYKIAVVSPELHNRNIDHEFQYIQELVNSKIIDAVCTDNPNRWNYD